MNMRPRSWIRAGIAAGFLATGFGTSHAVEVNLQSVAKDVCAHTGDPEGRSFDNQGLNANIGLIVTPAGAVRIDSGASFQSARQIAQAVRKVTPQHIKWAINAGTEKSPHWPNHTPTRATCSGPCASTPAGRWKTAPTSAPPSSRAIPRRSQA